MKAIAKIRTLTVTNEWCQRFGLKPSRYRLEHHGPKQVDAVRVGFPFIRVSLYAHPGRRFVANYETATVADWEIRKIIAELERRVSQPAAR